MSISTSAFGSSGCPIFELNVEGGLVRYLFNSIEVIQLVPLVGQPVPDILPLLNLIYVIDFVPNVLDGAIVPYLIDDDVLVLNNHVKDLVFL